MHLRRTYVDRLSRGEISDTISNLCIAWSSWAVSFQYVTKEPKQTLTVPLNHPQYAVAPHASIYVAFLTNLSKGTSRVLSLSHFSRPSPIYHEKADALASAPCLCAVFLNSLLAALNSRQAIRAQMAGAADMLSIPQWRGTDAILHDRDGPKESKMGMQGTLVGRLAAAL